MNDMLMDRLRAGADELALGLDEAQCERLMEFLALLLFVAIVIIYRLTS